jgi:predicted RNA-binding Zn-ribbon protein involved in translation (DUF1610 family)
MTPSRRAASLTGLSLTCDECGKVGLRLLRMYIHGNTYQCPRCRAVHLKGGGA